MNPNSCLVPILGAFKLKLLQSDDVTPIAFLLMRDVLDINRNQIGPYDRLYSFEFKGKNRQVLLNPKDIFDLDADYHEYKELIFKELDFIKSFNKLDIAQCQSERILSALQNDIDLLRK